MNTKKMIAWGLIGVGGLDLVLGKTSTPLPVIGDYLSQETDALLIGACILLLFVL
jgi:hypothetical protein